MDERLALLVFDMAALASISSFQMVGRRLITGTATRTDFGDTT